MLPFFKEKQPSQPKIPQTLEGSGAKKNKKQCPNELVPFFFNERCHISTVCPLTLGFPIPPKEQRKPRAGAVCSEGRERTRETSLS